MRSSTRSCASLTGPSSSLLNEFLSADSRSLCFVGVISSIVSIVSDVVALTSRVGVMVGEGGRGIICGRNSDWALDLWDGEGSRCLSWSVSSSLRIYASLSRSSSSRSLTFYIIVSPCLSGGVDQNKDKALA